MDQDIDVQTALREGDIFLSVKTINNLFTDGTIINEEICSAIGVALAKFSSVFIPIEYSELMLTSVAKLTESQQNEINPFVQSSTFLSSLLQVIKDFYSIKLKSLYNTSSYASHYCYELSLYILLGLLEKSSWLNVFMETLPKDELIISVNAISAILQADTLYITQEMALEIICRILYNLITSDDEQAQLILTSLPLIFHGPLATKGGVISVLRDMRPLLTVMNQSNSNIESVKITNVTIKSILSTKLRSSDSMEGWLDLCSDYICFHVAKIQQLIRFEYSAISHVTINADASTLTFLTSKPNPKLAQLLSLKTLVEQNTTLSLSFTLQNSKQLIPAKEFIEKCIALKNETLDTNSKPGKYSIVTSKTSKSNQNDDTTTHANEVSSVSSPDMQVGPSNHQLSALRAAKRLKSHKEDSLLVSQRLSEESAAKLPSYKDQPQKQPFTIPKAISSAPKPKKLVQETKQAHKTSTVVKSGVVSRRGRPAKESKYTPPPVKAKTSNKKVPLQRKQTPSKNTFDDVGDIASIISGAYFEPNVDDDSINTTNTSKKLTPRMTTVGSWSKRSQQQQVEKHSKDSEKKVEGIRTTTPAGKKGQKEIQTKKEHQSNKSKVKPTTAAATLKTATPFTIYDENIDAQKELKQRKPITTYGNTSVHGNKENLLNKSLRDDLSSSMNHYEGMDIVSKQSDVFPRSGFPQQNAARLEREGQDVQSKHSKAGIQSYTEQTQKSAPVNYNHNELPTPMFQEQDQVTKFESLSVSRYIPGGDVLLSPSVKPKIVQQQPSRPTLEQTSSISQSSSSQSTDYAEPIDTMLSQLSLLKSAKRNKEYHDEEYDASSKKQRLFYDYHDANIARSDINLKSMFYPPRKDKLGTKNDFEDVEEIMQDFVSSNDEDSIISNLIKEIVNMQKDRARRKRTKTLLMIQNQALDQIENYLRQWLELNKEYQTDVTSSVSRQLDSLRLTMVSLTKSFQQQCDQLGNTERDLSSQLVFLQSNVMSFRTNHANMLDDAKNDVEKVKYELVNMRNQVYKDALEIVKEANASTRRK